MRVNLSKTKVMFFLEEGALIEVVNAYKYLGKWFTPKLENSKTWWYRRTALRVYITYRWYYLCSSSDARGTFSYRNRWSNIPMTERIRNYCNLTNTSVIEDWK